MQMAPEPVYWNAIQLLLALCGMIQFASLLPNFVVKLKKQCRCEIERCRSVLKPSHTNHWKEISLCKRVAMVDEAETE